MIMQALLAVIFVLMPFAMFDGVLPDQDSSATVADNSGRAGFIAVDGATLETRIELAVTRGRAASSGSAYWVAYGFDVRPGVAVDFEMRNVRGVTTFDGLTIQENSKVETRNVAVFMLYEDGASKPSRVEVYNLDRKRNYGGHPVYWTGHADSGESLTLLRGMVASSADGEVTHHAVVAIGLHADPRVADILKAIILG